MLYYSTLNRVWEHINLFSKPSRLLKLSRTPACLLLLKDVLTNLSFADIFRLNLFTQNTQTNQKKTRITDKFITHINKLTRMYLKICRSFVIHQKYANVHWESNALHWLLSTLRCHSFVLFAVCNLHSTNEVNLSVLSFHEYMFLRNVEKYSISIHSDR